LYDNIYDNNDNGGNDNNYIRESVMGYILGRYGYDFTTRKDADIAIKHNYIDILQKMHKNNCDNDNNNNNNNDAIIFCVRDADIACEYGQLDVLKYFISLGIECFDGSIEMAIHNNHLHIIRYAHEILKYNLGKYIFTMHAVLLNRLQIVEYLLQTNYNYRFNIEHINHAKYRGHTKMVDLLYKYTKMVDLSKSVDLDRYY
jgi:hypothetical protein